LFEALHKELEALRPALVVLDPLAVFGAGEVETDNGAAGDFMAALNGLATATGSAVLLVHHTTKAGRKAGDASAVNVRGSSALTDNARWVAELRTDDDDALTLSITKNNYAAAVDPVRLTGDGVRLRAETPDKAAEREELAFNRKVAAAVEKNAFDKRLKAAIAAAEKGGDEEKPKRGAARFKI
jgi:RecA-family ATPase